MNSKPKLDNFDRVFGIRKFEREERSNSNILIKQKSTTKLSTGVIKSFSHVYSMPKREQTPKRSTSRINIAVSNMKSLREGPKPALTASATKFFNDYYSPKKQLSRSVVRIGNYVSEKYTDSRVTNNNGNRLLELTNQVNTNRQRVLEQNVDSSLLKSPQQSMVEGYSSDMPLVNSSTPTAKVILLQSSPTRNKPAEVDSKPTDSDQFCSLLNKVKDNSLMKSDLPLIKRESVIKKDFNSVRLNNQSKNQLSKITDNNKQNNRRLHFRNVTSSRRNPSISKIKMNEEVSPVIKQRSNSANLPISNNLIALRPLSDDIIGFIRLKEGALPPFESATCTIKKYGNIEAFAVNTHKGTVRLHNEDRVSILLNAQNKTRSNKINQKQKYNCSIFSVFDGHGGKECCNFLKEHLHNSLVDVLDMEGFFISSLKRQYQTLDETYIRSAIGKDNNFAGSCAITFLAFNNSLFIINTGDSRAIISQNGGLKAVAVSEDHKPGNQSEFTRIIENGGELYRMSFNKKTSQNMFYFAKTHSQMKKIDDLETNSKHLIFGPWRVRPGGLSVSRSFGDLESKIPSLGGITGVVISEPEITEFKLEDTDFVFLACNIISRRGLRFAFK